MVNFHIFVKLVSLMKKWYNLTIQNALTNMHPVGAYLSDEKKYQKYLFLLRGFNVNKFFYLIVTLIFIVSFILRFILARNAPLTQDEKETIVISKSICVISDNINLPYRDSLTPHPLLTPYLIKAGESIWGNNVYGFRFFSFITGILATIFIFLLSTETIGKRAGIIALVLSSFNLYHLGRSLMAVDDVIMLFFAILSIYTLVKAIRNEAYSLLVWCGISLGLGYLADMKIALLIPIIMVYLVIYRRNIFKKKEVYIMLLIPISIISFDAYWQMSYENIVKMKLWTNISEISISRTGINFYLIRPISYILDIDYRTTISWEKPTMSFLDGIVIIMGVIYSFKNWKDKIIRFMLMVFLFPVGLISLFPKGEFWWSGISLWPGIYLASLALSELWRRKRVYKYCIFVLLIMLVGQSFWFLAGIKELNIPPNRYGLYVDYDMDLMKWYFEKGLLDEAIAEAREALKICPNELRINNFLQKCLLIKRK